MADEQKTPEQKAKELQEKLGGKKPDEPAGDPVADALKNMDAVMKRLSGWLNAQGAKDAYDDDDDDDELRNPGGKQRGEDDPVPEDGKRPGDAEPLAADANCKADDFQGRAKFADAQSRADEVYSAYSQSAPPPSMAGEKLLDYRRRLVRPLQQHSPEFKNVDLYRLDPVVFSGIESRIYADAMQVARNPANLCGPGELRAVHTRDAGNRTITSYYGDPRSWMDDFAPPVVRYLVGVNWRGNKRDD